MRAPRKKERVVGGLCDGWGVEEENMNALQVRLVMLNRQLDQEHLGKVERCRIRREAERIRLRIDGKDPGWFAGVGVKGGKPEPEKRNAYAQKKSVIELLDLIDR